MRIKCEAKKTGYWQDRRIVAAKDPMRDRLAPPFGTPDTFILDERGFRYDEDGAVLVDEDLRPILPRWVKPLDPVPKIDPATVPHRIIEAPAKVKAAKRAEAQAKLADPVEAESAADEFVAPKKRGPGRPRKNDASVI